VTGIAISDTELWWKKNNSLVIWLFSAAIFVIIIFTSIDYSKNYPNLSSFGTNQLILFGIIVVLLLYRHISKIKFGDFEIEFNILKEKLENTDKLLTQVQHTQQILAKDISFIDAKAEINKAIGIIDIIKSKLEYNR
jgi:hypothetical protein